MSYIYVNGEIVSSEDAKISAWDRSYLFGEGLFETFRSYDGKLPFLENHINRLSWSSTFLEIPFDLKELNWICLELLKKNNLKEARFKLVLSQSQIPGVDQNPKTQITIFCSDLKKQDLKKDFKLKVIQSLKNDDQPLATIKSTNYLTKILAKKEATDSGYDDGILLNHKDYVTETTTGNIFWVDAGGKLSTIIKDSYHLAGTTAFELVKLLKDNSIKCESHMITAKELSHAKEIFITNAIVGVMPVSQVDHRKISGAQAGDITLMIQDLWNKYIKSLTEDAHDQDSTSTH